MTGPGDSAGRGALSNNLSVRANPMKFKESAGIAKLFIDEEERSLLSRLGFTMRQTSRRIFVDTPALDGGLAPVGDETQSKSTVDGGLEWVTDYKTKVLEDRVTWTSKLSIYQPFFYSKQDDFDDNIQQLIDAGISGDRGFHDGRRCRFREYLQYPDHQGDLGTEDILGWSLHTLGI